MNVLSIQYCGLALITMILYLSIRHIRLPIKSYRIYLGTVTNGFFCLLLDIASLYAITYRHRFGFALTAFICKFYIVTLSTEAFLALYYILDTIIHEQKFRMFRYIVSSAEIISVLLTFIMPIYIDDADPSKIHTYGPATVITYGSCIIFIITTLIICAIYHQYLSRRRFVTVITWMAIWFSAALFQYVTDSAQIVAYAMVLGILMLFTEVENPDFYLERDTGLLNSHAFNLWISQNLNNTFRYSCLEVVIKNENDYVYNEDIHTAIVINLSKRLASFKKTLVFKDTSMSFLMIFRHEQEMYVAMRALKAMLDNSFTADGVEVRLDAAFLAIPGLGVIDTPSQIFQIQSWYLHDHPDIRVATIGYQEIAEETNKRKTCNMVTRAINENRLEVFYQPIYSLSAGSFTAAEALVRIRDIDGNIIPPASFIPVIESSSMIKELGETIFENVCIFLSEVDISKLGITFIAVNLSARQCSEPDLADRFISIMNRYNIDPHLIDLEITESTAITSRSILLKNMKKLVDVGTRFALDDFGTGQSNIDYIISIPVSIVKFDRKLTQSYFIDEKSRYIMINIIRMIKQLKLIIVSEGVETSEQLGTMASLGVDYIQGYYFSKPLPQGEFVSFIKDRNKKYDA